MQRNSSTYTFGFAAIICVFCALILANAATLLKPKQVANAQLDILVNILGAVGHDVPELKKKPSEEVFTLFDKEFDVILLDENNNETDRDFMEKELVSLGYPEADIKGLDKGALLSKFETKKALLAKKSDKSLEEYDPNYKVVYVHKASGSADAYVIPIDGYGLWDLMKGYIALGTDLNTVKGITFYEHKETPGLGAEVTQDWFKDQWKGKKILKDGKLVSVTIAKGQGSGGPHEVDGMSGATLTGNGINDFILADLQRYEPYFKTLRN